jgi:hypothetical protein
MEFTLIEFQRFAFTPSPPASSIQSQSLIPMKSLLLNKLAILACFACWTLPLTAQVPNLISHQGRVAVRENPSDPPVNFDGNGQFKFALVNGDGATLWSNDNTSTAGSEPVGAVSLTVNKGLYSVMLGEGMWNIPATVFQSDPLLLRVWFSDGTAKSFQRLYPDQRLAPNGYLPDGAVSAGNLADGSITGAKIAAGTVNSSKIEAGTVIPPVMVSGSGPQMIANRSYAATGAAPITFLLPATANVGDTVEVSGAGPAGWAVWAGAGQSIVAPWVARENERAWYAVTSSADGNKLVAAEYNGRIHTSTDGGVTWVARDSNRSWWSLASSADGVKLVASTNGTGLYTSTDSGATWSQRNPTLSARALASSSDGSILIAAVYGGSMYISSDSGASWTQMPPSLGDRLWRALACSSDGSTIVAVVQGGQIYTSTNSGVNWTARETNQVWHDVAASSDGTKLAAVVYGGYIYTSNDSGENWVQRGPFSYWSSIASSSDGTKLVAVAEGGRIYVSTNSGETWHARDNQRIWRSVASSANGLRMVAVVEGGKIYTTDPTVGGGLGEKITMQYLGDGQWTSGALSGNASALTGLNASSLTGSVPPATLTSVPASSLTGSIPAASLTTVPATNLTGSVPSTALTSVPAGNLTGSVPPTALSSVPAGNLTGSVPSGALTSVPAPNLTGTISDARLSTNVALRGGGNSFSGNQSITGSLTATGSAGFGTASPQTQLHLYSSGNPTVMRLQSSASPGFGRLEFLSNPQGDANEWRPAYIQSTDAGSFSGGLKFVTNGTGAANKFGEVETMRIQNGSVGIGTANPGQTLQVGDVNTSNSLGMMRFASRSGVGPANRYWDIGVPQAGEDASGKYYSFVIDDPQLSTEPEVVVRFDTGNMGIGITSPSSKLHVNGTVTATAFNPPSDRNLKENFETVDSREVLEKVAAMPISRWNFIGDAGTPHIGPMAQDFHAAFGTGTDDKHIATVDADGVALAAIQGLNAKLAEKEAEIAELKAKNATIEQRLSDLEMLIRKASPNSTHVHGDR